MAAIDNFPLGQIFGDMLVTDHVLNPDGKHKDLMCVCVRCNRPKQIYVSNIKRKPNVLLHSSCGYGLPKDHPLLYGKWTGFRNRINNSTGAKYEAYNASGLTSDYDVFADFYDDMAESYYAHVAVYGEEDTVLDRIDYNLGYVRGNLRWCTHFEQTMNRRCMQANVFVCYAPLQPGQQFRDVYITDNMSAFCRNHGITHGNVSKLLRKERTHVNGWNIIRYNELPSDELLFIPGHFIFEMYRDMTGIDTFNCRRVVHEYNQ